MTAKKTSKTSTPKKPAANRPILTGNDALAVLKNPSPKKALAAIAERRAAATGEAAPATPTDPPPPKAPRVAKAAPDGPQEELVVFAFRLTREERDLIHGATGPSKASRFVRTLAVAGARKDEDAIKEILAGLTPAA